jgi:hypothetical protein
MYNTLVSLASVLALIRRTPDGDVTAFAGSFVLRRSQVMQRAPGQLAIHPEDAPLVRARLGESLTQSGWQIVEDATLSRGGCRLECQAGDIDASLEHRWQRLMETLGQTSTLIKSIPE